MAIDINVNIQGTFTPPPIDASNTPIEVGTPLVIPTTFPTGTNIKNLVIYGAGLDGTQLNVSFSDGSFSFTTGFNGVVKVNQTFVSDPSTVPNIDIVLTALTTNVTTGIFKIEVNTF